MREVVWKIIIQSGKGTGAVWILQSLCQPFSEFVFPPTASCNSHKPLESLFGPVIIELLMPANLVDEATINRSGTDVLKGWTEPSPTKRIAPCNGHNALNRPSCAAATRCRALNIGGRQTRDSAQDVGHFPAD